jgi:hypothetical protein
MALDKPLCVVFDFKSICFGPFEFEFAFGFEMRDFNTQFLKNSIKRFGKISV